MEIRIKTPEEFRSQHVRLEIKASREEAEEVTRRLLAPAAEIALGADKLLDLSNRAGMVENLSQRVKSMDADLNQAEAEIASLRTERDRFQDTAAERARTLETRLTQVSMLEKDNERLRAEQAAKTREIDALIGERDQARRAANLAADKLDSILAQVLDQSVVDAINSQSMALAGAAIRAMTKVREILSGETASQTE